MPVGTGVACDDTAIGDVGAGRPAELVGFGCRLITSGGKLILAEGSYVAGAVVLRADANKGSRLDTPRVALDPGSSSRDVGGFASRLTTSSAGITLAEASVPIVAVFSVTDADRGSTFDAPKLALEPGSSG